MSRTIADAVRPARAAGLLAAALLLLAACSSNPPAVPLAAAAPETVATEYLIGPGDMLRVFVWQNPDLSVTVPVRPDGRISIPLVQDMPAAQRTATQLADEIKTRLETYVRSPVVTVIVTDFVGPYSQQVRVVGEAAKPQAIPYRANMSVLDVMIAVGGLTKFAAGDRAVIDRRLAGQQEQVPVRLDALLRDGDLTANVPMRPGDVLVIPQSWF
ncbi:MAG: XrtA/PEP-CTERM system exopolysaccharide export protein [Dongiaceae bacterium]